MGIMPALFTKVSEDRAREPDHRGAQECIARGEAEVEPAGFVLALLGDQQGTTCSFGSPHALPEVIAMGVGWRRKQFRVVRFWVSGGRIYTKGAQRSS
jgi:hypothetical protein